MKTKHTPGPWRVISEQQPNYGCNLDGDPFYRQIIAGPDCATIIAGDMGESDARLIAAGPELLAACREALVELEDIAGPTMLGMLRSAIAKAEGR